VRYDRLSESRSDVELATTPALRFVQLPFTSRVNGLQLNLAGSVARSRWRLWPGASSVMSPCLLLHRVNFLIRVTNHENPSLVIMKNIPVCFAIRRCPVHIRGLFVRCKGSHRHPATGVRKVRLARNRGAVGNSNDGKRPESHLYLADNAVSKDSTRSLQSLAKVTATGTVEVKDGKNVLRSQDRMAQ